MTSCGGHARTAYQQNDQIPSVCGAGLGHRTRKCDMLEWAPVVPYGQNPKAGTLRRRPHGCGSGRIRRKPCRHLDLRCRACVRARLAQTGWVRLPRRLRRPKRVLVGIVRLVLGPSLWDGVDLAHMSGFALWVNRLWWMIGLVGRRICFVLRRLCMVDRRRSGSSCGPRCLL